MIRLGIIGVGNMGKNHLRIALELNRYFEVVGFYDNSHIKRDEIEKQFNVKGYDNIEELLEVIDACIIATPSSLHKEIGVIAAKHKVHTLMEKPLCLNLSDGAILKEAYKDLTFMVGHVERYNPVTDELSRILKNEQIVAIEVDRCSPYDSRIFDASVIMDLMIHDIDIIINDICHDPIKKIIAYGNNFHSPQKFDFVQALLKFESNIICSIIASRSTEDKIRTIKVHTNDCFVVADLLHRKLTITRRTNCAYSENQEYKQDNIVETVMLPFIEPLKAEQMEFYNCIINGKIPKTDVDSSMKTLKLCTLIEELCEESR